MHVFEGEYPSHVVEVEGEYHHLCMHVVGGSEYHYLVCVAVGESFLSV